MSEEGSGEIQTQPKLQAETKGSTLPNPGRRNFLKTAGISALTLAAASVVDKSAIFDIDRFNRVSVENENGKLTMFFESHNQTPTLNDLQESGEFDAIYYESLILGKKCLMCQSQV